MTSQELVTIEERAQENGLALMIHGLLSEAVEASASKRADLDKMSSTLAIVAPDAEVAVTLQFGGGRCQVRDGRAHDADLCIVADSYKIPELSLLQIRHGLPWLFDEKGKNFVKDLVERKIKIEGLIRFPPTPLRTAKAGFDLVLLTRILSVT